MIKEAIEKILSLASINTATIGDQIFTNSDLRRVPDAVTDTLKVRNLQGIVDYLRNNFDSKMPVIVHVISPTQVNVVTGFNRDLNRSTLIEATALLPEIKFGWFYDIESFNILLQSCFVDTEQKQRILSIVGNVVDEKVVTVGDTGISQQVTAKAGIATVEPVVLPNPVHLKPYRTFVEIKQPESAFVFRMKDGPSAALFEADGGAWKLDAIEEIKLYFSKELEQLIADGHVVIVG
ncbi:hypothetical protein J2TS6_42410 [Paenibacillus albilobatus]|uniref:Phage protein n=1 Tax=Paenibacillus albilobatus TaxID=2716884 RepID=A0A920CB87_9BACL|nr:hypothetical protein [Paenibacillus albilobatus]GIO33100.1 hypothetical protein J2TS6_42410 [Paenibacillus albilobatus]